LSEGVLLLHALARRPASLAPLAQRLRAAGFETLIPAYPSRRQTIFDCAHGLAAEVSAFAARVERVHFVGHSMGGLVARACVALARPANFSRMVTLGTPHGGSELAAFLVRGPLFRAFYGPAFEELTVAASPALNARLGPVDFPLGCIAGRRALNLLAQRFILPRPNDGAVSVAAAQAPGMADHRVVDCDHTFLPSHPPTMALVSAFLTRGRFPE